MKRTVLAKDWLLRNVVFRQPLLFGLYARRKSPRRREPPKRGPASAVLQSEAEWRRAADDVRDLGLPSYDSFPAKNWDSLLALRVLLAETRPTARILDAGGETYSVVLPWLYLYGYRNLTAQNLSFARARWDRGVQYCPGDITRTGFPAGEFDGVTCLSVIEHGVEPDALLAEMHRVMSSRAVLIVSTDYFETPVDTSGRAAFGVPIHVFDRREIEDFIELARTHSFELIDRPDLRCSDRPVEWAEHCLRYTFVALSFRRR